MTNEELLAMLDEKANLIDRYKAKLIEAAERVNRNAKEKDVNRNHVNYGVVTTCADILRDLGEEIEAPCYGVDDYLRIPEVIVNGKKMYDCIDDDDGL